MTGPADLIEPGAPPGGRGEAVDRVPAAEADDSTAGPLTAIEFPSPLGPMIIEADGLGVRALRWGEGASSEGARAEQAAPLLVEARDQVLAYFEGRLRRFSLPLSPQGTRFQRTVWGFINEIPFGCTLRYGELAELVASGARAAARACGANPLPLIIPCHRVVGATPGAGGYSAPGGMETKRLLLCFEEQHVTGTHRTAAPARRCRLGIVPRAGDAVEA